MTNMFLINYIATKVYEQAYNYNIDVVADLIMNHRTGNRELKFSFRKNGKRVDEVVYEADICMAKDLDFIVNSVTEKMKYVL